MDTKRFEAMGLLDEQGRLQRYAWPGGYNIVYQTADGGVLCAKCAQEAVDQQLDTPDDPQWNIVRGFVYWEGETIQCDHCYTDIQSEYGDPTVKDILKSENQKETK
jgi:hypothetical protein